MSIVLFSIFSILTVIWHILAFKFRNNQSPPLQKGFTVLIYIRLTLCLITIYFIYLCIKSSEAPLAPLNTDDLMRIYVETIIITLNAVLQTLVWFNVLVISYGWQIHRALLNRTELRNLVVVFILLYMFICFDQIFDMMIPFKVWKFLPSDIKNIFLYGFLAFITVKYCEKSKKIIRNRCIYALHYTREYYPALKLKYQMVNQHIIATIIYSLMFISMVLINRTILQDLISSQFKLMIHYYIDTLGLAFYLIIYRPRLLPNYFFIFYDHLAEGNNLTEDCGQNFNIYEAKVDLSDQRLESLDRMSFNENISLNGEEKNDKKNKKGKKNKVPDKKYKNGEESSPFVVINPFFKKDTPDHEDTHSKSNYFLECVVIGRPKKF